MKLRFVQINFNVCKKRKRKEKKKIKKNFDLHDIHTPKSQFLKSANSTPNA